MPPKPRRLLLLKQPKPAPSAPQTKPQPKPPAAVGVSEGRPDLAPLLRLLRRIRG